MLPYWLASRPIKGRASALSVLQSESYLLTDQLCNNHVQNSRTLLTLTGGHLDLWPWELQPRVPSILLVSLLLILKMSNLKKWRFQGGQEMEKLSKNQSCVWRFPKKDPYLRLYLVRGPCPRLMPNFHPLQKMQIIWIINYYFSFVDFLDFVILEWRDRVLTHVRFRQTLIYHHCGFLNHARRATACVLTRRVQSMFLNSKWFCHKSIGNESGFESEQKFTKFELKIELGPHLVWLRNLLTNRRSRST